MELYEVKTEVPAPQKNSLNSDGYHGDKEDTKPSTAGTELGSEERHPVYEYFEKLRIYKDRYNRRLILARNALLLAGYFVYFGFAVKHHQGDEDSWRLVGFTIFGVLLVTWRLLNNKTAFGPKWTRFVAAAHRGYGTGRRSCVVRWCLYVAMTAFMVTYIIVFIAIKFPENLRSLMGLAAFPIMLFLYSNNKRKINWHTVYWCMAIQFIMALLILKTNWGASIISWFGDRLTELVANADAGSKFIFGETYTDHMFVFGSMVQGMCVIVGISVLTYLGVIKFIVETLGRALAFMLQTSPAEGINAVGSIFLQVPESVMLVQEYVVDMTPSQFFVTYSAGLTTVGGVSLIIFIASGVPAAPLIAASAMSAPAALAASKITFPSHKEEKAPKAPARPTLLRMPTSLADSVIAGINQSVAVIVQVVAFILTFIIILEFCNNTLMWFGDRVGVSDFTIEYVFSYVFYPFAFLMGARAEDCLFIGELLGTRTFGMAVITYPKLGPIIQNGIVFRKYIAETANNSWSEVGNDVFLESMNTTLVGGVIQARSEVIATYACCGSASFAVMGLIIGSFGVLIPYRQQEITDNIFRAFVVGTMASYLTACFAGLLFEEGVGYE